MERELAARSAITADLQTTVEELTAKLETRDLRVQELEREKEVARQQMLQAAAVVDEREKTLARIKELEAELEEREAKIRIYEVRATFQALSPLSWLLCFSICFRLESHRKWTAGTH